MHSVLRSQRAHWESDCCRGYICRLSFFLFSRLPHLSFILLIGVLEADCRGIGRTRRDTR